MMKLLLLLFLFAYAEKDNYIQCVRNCDWSHTLHELKGCVKTCQLIHDCLENNHKDVHNAVNKIIQTRYDELLYNDKIKGKFI
jgi:hypothetical protein